MMSYSKFAAAAAIAIATAMLVSACGSGGSENSAAGSSVNIGLELEPTNLNVRTTSGIALDQVLIDNVYQGLVGRGADGSIVDVLAKSHSVSADGLNYSFVLNSGVSFHDRAKLTADDVVYSIAQVAKDAKLAGLDDLADVASVSKQNDSTVLITLTRPNSSLLWNLTGRAGLIIEKAAKNSLATTANGTGPYRLGSWKQGDSLTLLRNDSYWGRKAKVAKVVFHYFTDPTAAVNATLGGDLDVQADLDPTLRSQLAGHNDLRIVTGKTTDKYTLAFNDAKAPFTDPRVRTAIREAIDTAALITATGGTAVRQGGPIPALDPGYENLDSVDSFNLADAKRLLADAGTPALHLTLTIPNIYSSAVSDVLVSQLAAAGITLTVHSVEFATWLTDVFTNHDFDLSYVDHAESHDFGNWANPDYYFGYDSQPVQQLYAESLAATDPAVVAAKLKQAARIVSKDAAAEWLFTATTSTVIRTGVTGFPTDSTSTRLNLADLATK